ncbi:MAG TPA: hypothetical protein P5042_01435 [Candidatus Izemoplasmatales bacterium]|nr:hypothetical protein [Candidatus Izemoplasmatales bacterium]
MIEPYDVVSIIGNAKNAGKTTVLNYLLERMKKKVIGVSSIGMDGEPLDNVSFLPKPRIHLWPGTLVATAEKFLETATIGEKILKRTDISTPFGNIVVAEAVKPGNILVAGPSTIADMEKIVHIFHEHGAQKKFIDGAFARQSTAKMADGTILVSGANRSPVMDEVINDTERVIRRLSIPKSEKNLLTRNEWKKTEIFDFEGNWIGASEHSAVMDPEATLGLLGPGVGYLYVPGATTAEFVRKFIKTKDAGMSKLVVYSPTNLIADDFIDVFPKAAEGRIQTVRPVNIVALCYNPFSPAGYVFDDNEFYERLRTLTDLPIFNVLSERNECR